MKKNQKAEELKRILIVGSGGRENSIAWALSKNQSIEKIYVCPGNGGTANFEKCICLKPKAEDAQTIIEESQLLGINLVIIGPEIPLAEGPPPPQLSNLLLLRSTRTPTPASTPGSPPS